MRLTLATKFTILVLLLVVLGFLDGLATLIFTRGVAGSLDLVVGNEIPGRMAALDLKIGLLEQKAALSAYILGDGNPAWLEKSTKAEPEAAAQLSRVREYTNTVEEATALAKLEQAYSDYCAKRRGAISQFTQGNRRESAKLLLTDVWPAQDDIVVQCNAFIEAINRHIAASTKQAKQHVAVANWGFLFGSLGTASLAALLLWLVILRVLLPLRRMATEARAIVGHAPGTRAEAEDELRSVGTYFRALMAGVTDARTSLAESRNRMLNAEKLASIGKLAASVAHEMRNPLSSMKMWLYSIRKTAQAEPGLDHKYQILADEIRRLESIVGNVLEFSRPPSLKLQPSNIAKIVEKTLEIVRPWLETKKVRIVLQDAMELPKVTADSEQLKQVFINLLDNAAEAMPGGGEICISSCVETDANGSGRVVVRVRDTGHGIPEKIRGRLFEPFFTTKSEGTGLGLCIAANIVAAQGGQLTLESSTTDGSTFVIRLPIAAEKSDE